MNKRPIILVIIVLGAAGSTMIISRRKLQPQPSISISNVTPLSTTIEHPASLAPTITPVATVAPPTASPVLIAPIAEFHQRITKKFFGTFVTPARSPVQPERFTGYHTGVDVEYGDVSTDVPVVAVADGTVVQSGWVSGYGGLLVIKAMINQETVFILYGHVRMSSLPAPGISVHQGKQIGVLGTGGTHETDGERHHLHFALYKGKSLDIRGYVPRLTDLATWIDPLSLYL